MYSRDPRWIIAKFASSCGGCDRRISKGEDIFYYPMGKRAYGGQCGCGGNASRDFASTIASEDYQAY